MTPTSNSVNGTGGKRNGHRRRPLASTNGTSNGAKVMTVERTGLEHEKQGEEKRNASNLVLLFICATGICSCYLTFGLLQERLFARDSDARIGAAGPITTFLLLTSTLSNVLVAHIWKFIQQAITQPSKAHEERSLKDNIQQRYGLDHGLLMKTSFCYICAMTFSNESLAYVSYPTAVLAKSSKLIPTMIMGLLVEKRRFAGAEWVGAACITVGIAFFNFSRMKKPAAGSSVKQDSPYGVGLLLLSLAMDGLLASCQGLLKRPFQLLANPFRPPSAVETMFYINLYGSFLLLPVAFFGGHMENGLRLLVPSIYGDYDAPVAWDMARSIFYMNVAASAGQIFIFLTIFYFSPLMCTTITTTRKFFTILLSVSNFGHVFNATQWTSIVLVFGGLYLEIAAKFGHKRSTGQGKKNAIVVDASKAV